MSHRYYLPQWSKFFVDDTKLQPKGLLFGRIRVERFAIQPHHIVPIFVDCGNGCAMTPGDGTERA
jgi:hypothetical protein